MHYATKLRPVLIVGIALTLVLTLLNWPQLQSPQDVQAQPGSGTAIRVSIERVLAIANFEPGLGKEDFYAVVTVDGQEFETSVVEEASEVVGGLVPDDWTITAIVDSSESSVPVIIEVYDADGVVRFRDDKANITPVDGRRSLELTVNLSSCVVSGDLSGQCHETLIGEGTGSDEALIEFNVQVILPGDGAIFVADAGTGLVHVFDPSGVELTTFPSAFSEGDELAAGNVIGGDDTVEAIVADSNTGTIEVFVDFRSFLSINADFGPGDAVAVGNVTGAPGDDEIVVADQSSGTVSIYSVNAAGSSNLIDTFDLDYSFFDRIAVADIEGAANDVGDGIREVLVADAETGAVAAYRPQSGALIGQISEAAFASTDGFAAGSLGGFGLEEFVIGDASSGNVRVFEFNLGSTGDRTVGTFAAGVDTNDGFAVADVYANATNEIVIADAENGTIDIYRFDPVTGSASDPISSFSSNFSTGDGFAAGSVALPDQDGDGLPDRWEKQGLDADGDGVIDVDLPAMGADPQHKDIFVELDVENGRAPSRESIQLAKEVFAEAPADAGGVTNPDGQKGINLWVDTGGLVDADGIQVGDNLGNTDNEIASNDVPDLGICGLEDGVFYDLKAEYFNPARHFVFHYAIATPFNSASCPPDSDTSALGGQGEIGGNDFIVHESPSDEFEYALMFVHELGHNLNLRHGGFEGLNCKPNYVSVMSYSHSNVGIPQARDGGNAIIDFSPPRFDGGRGNAPLPRLVEDALDETIVLDETDPANRFFFSDTNGNFVQHKLDKPVDWDSNPNTTLTDVPPTNINEPFPVCDDGKDADNTTDDVLNGHDDWKNLSLPFRQFGNLADAPINPVDPATEPNEEARAEIREAMNTTDLTISKSDSADPVHVGDELTYSLVVTNNGPNPADAVQVVDTLPDGVTYQHDNAGCAEASGTVTCDLGLIAAGDSRDLEITVVVDLDLDFSGGSPAVLINAAEVSNLAPEAKDSNPDDNTAEETTEVHAVADLEIVSFEVADAPLEILVGESAGVTLEKIVTNNGPSSPVDAELSVTAAVLVPAEGGIGVEPDPANPGEVPAIATDELRGVDEAFTISCLGPGSFTATFTNTIYPLNPGDLDPDTSNNQAQVQVTVECVVPVAIDIKPDESPNPINLRSNGVVPVAALSNEAGEFGLPLAFDATTIDPLSVLFGPPDTLFNVPQPDGAPETHDRGHIEGDDMVLHFRVQETGLDANDSEACVKGSFTSEAGATFSFFGCDSIEIRP